MKVKIKRSAVDISTAFILVVSLIVLGIPGATNALIILPTNFAMIEIAGKKMFGPVIWDNYPLMSVTMGKELIDDGEFHLLDRGDGSYYHYKIVTEITADGTIHKKVIGWILAGCVVVLCGVAIYVVATAANKVTPVTNSPAPPSSGGTNSSPGGPPPGKYGIWQAIKDLLGIKRLERKDFTEKDILFVREIKFTGREDISAKGYLDLNDPSNGVGHYFEYREGKLPLMRSKLNDLGGTWSNFTAQFWYSDIGRSVKIYDGAGELVTSTWISNSPTNTWGTTNWGIPMNGYWLSKTNQAKFHWWPPYPVDTNFVDIFEN